MLVTSILTLTAGVLATLGKSVYDFIILSKKTMLFINPAGFIPVTVTLSWLQEENWSSVVHQPANGLSSIVHQKPTQA